MTKIPENAGREFLSGLHLISRGKVRDTYALPDPEKLLVVASNRVSIFDFVLSAEIPQKGEILTAMNIFWASQLANIVSQDIVAFGDKICDHLPSDFWNDRELQRRAIVVKKLKMIPIEAIVRGYLTGSGWSAYKKTAPRHKVCGHLLPEGFRDGDFLLDTLFTPTTKATEGHDEHLAIQGVREQFGTEIEDLSVRLFHRASEIADRRGVIIADTKFEFGLDPSTGGITLGDERFTPDSSRFWLKDDWKTSREEGRSPVSFDKQFVRDWGKTVGLDSKEINPSRDEDIAKVHALTVPNEVITETARIYHIIFERLTGMKLGWFQERHMHCTQLPA